MEAIQKVPNREGASSSAEEVRDWVMTIEKECEHVTVSGISFELLMRRVPESLAKHHPDAYTPRIVSFGPYHHGAAHLARTEQHKQWVLVQLLAVSGIENPFPRCVEVMKVEQRLEGYYEELDEQWKKPNRFLKMMILDGFFVLAVLFMHKRQNEGLEDWIFRPNWGTYIMLMIRRDMLLLDNQLPMLLLQTLMEALRREERLMEALWLRLIFELGEEPPQSSASVLRKLILSFLDPELEDDDVLTLSDDEFGFHILDVYRRRKISRIYSRIYSPLRSQSMRWSAAELDIAGVKFRMSSSGTFDSISFLSDNGILELPCIKIDNTTEILLLNLMALEHYWHVKANVIGYVRFMVRLIRSSRDVTLLRTKTIIRAPDSINDEDVVKLFKQVSKGVLAGIHTLEGGEDERDEDDIGAKINDYLNNNRCPKLWNMMVGMYISYFERASPSWLPDYFRRQWAGLTLFMAIFYLATTILQTVYTVLPSHQHN